MQTFDLLFFGAFSMILVYNFAYFYVQRSNTYFEYFFYHVLVFIMMLTYTKSFEAGFFSFNLGNTPMVIFTMSLIILTSFTRSFLRLEQQFLQADKGLKGLQLVGLGFFGLSMIEIQSTLLITLGIAYIILLVLSILSISMYLGFKKNDMYAKFYFLGFTGILVSLASSLLSFFNLSVQKINYNYVFELSILFEAAVFSFALTHKYQDTKLKLHQNELLFKELSHRVKNNLQTIISILSLQKSRIDDTTMNIYLEDTIKRIASISLIHEKLQYTKNVGFINVHSYLNSFVQEFQKLDDSFKFDILCDESLYLSVEQLTPLGLILNELLTNSLKHAFEDVKNPVIELSFTKENNYEFCYKDNGNGYKNSKKSLGSLLIETLSKAQLKGKYEIESQDKFTYSLQF